MRRPVALLATACAALVLAGSAAAADRTTHVTARGAIAEAFWSDFDPEAPPGTLFTSYSLLAADQSARTDRIPETRKLVDLDVFRTYLDADGNEVVVSFAGWTGPATVSVAKKLAAASATADDLPVSACDGPAAYCSGLRPIDLQALWTATTPLERRVDRLHFAFGSILFNSHVNSRERFATAAATIDGVPIAVPFSGAYISDGRVVEVEVCRGPAC